MLTRLPIRFALCSVIVLPSIVACFGPPPPPLPDDILYLNDFEDGIANGDEYFGSGRGSRISDVQVQVDFYPDHRPRTVRYADGTAGVRMSTFLESQHGFDHSLFRPLIAVTGETLREPSLRFSWIAVLPQLFDHSVRPAAYEDRTIFAFNERDDVGNELEAFSVRFIDNATLGLFVDDVAAGPLIFLSEPLVGGTEHAVSVDIDITDGSVAASFDGATHAPFVLDEVPTPSRYLVTPGGNSIASDTDTTLFSSLQTVEIRRPDE